MQTQAPNKAKLIIAALFAISCAGLTIFVWVSFGGSTPFAPRGYEVKILFPNASNLAPQSDVRIAGASVGKVVAIAHRQLATEATIQLNRQYAPLPADALAIIRNKTLLGETYIDLTPGTRSAKPIPDRGLLSTHNVASFQTIDQVLGSFDAPTRAKFKQFMLEFAAGLKGRGEDINNALGNLAPTSEDLATVARILDHQRTSLATLLHDGAGVLQTVGQRGTDLQTVVTAGDQVLAATAAHDRSLTSTIDALPPFLSDIRATLTATDTFAGQAGPALKALLPAAPLLAPALASARRLAPQLADTLSRLEPVIVALRPAVPALDRIITQAKPLSNAIAAAGRQLDPLLALIALYRNELVSAFANGGDAGQATLPSINGPVHYARGIGFLTNEDLFGYPRRLASTRYNPYPEPGVLSDLKTGLHALGCANTSNPEPIPIIGTGGPPPCIQQGPWSFQGLSRDFPHVQAAK